LTVTIDGRETRVEPGTTVFEAASSLGIHIPHLCHHPILKPSGACRLCVVEVEGARGLMTACTTPVADGMKVETRTPRVVQARRVIIDLLLSNHPQDCLTCDSCGDCRLQDYAYEYGVEKSSYVGERGGRGYDESNPFIARDHDKCILCGRCVAVCQEVQGVAAIDYVGRGFTTKISTPYDDPLEDTPCEFCGNCVQVCPVGALTPRRSAGLGRTWETRKVDTVCPYCGVGCRIDLHVRDGRIVGASGADGPANHGLLCVKGRFGYEFVGSPDRLTTPLVRRNGSLKPASWDEALGLVARRFSEIRERSGPDALAGLSSAKCTNEENYLVQKLVRAVFGTNNVDHCARLCHASTVTGLAHAFGSGAMTNSIEEIAEADALFIIGSNTTETHPVIALRVREAVSRGARLVVADPRRIELANIADIYLRQRPGTDVALLNGLMHVILEEGMHDVDFIETRTEGFADFHQALEEYTPERVEEITGVPAEDLVKAARIIGSAQRVSTLFAMGLTQHTCGTDNVLSVANLAMLTGNVGRHGCGVNPLRGQNNVQGACDMGALPNVYPGYQKVDDADARSRFEEAWGVSLPEKPGLTVVEMMDAAAKGDIKGMYIVGENPMVSDPDVGHVEEALKKLDFLVVQDIFLTPTAELADVVLPAASFAEKEGTFTNTERRVQALSKALDPVGESRPDWRIVCDLARAMGYEMRYGSPADVLDEIASLTPIYGGIRAHRLGREGLQWPCPDEGHPGTAFLHAGRFSRGKGRFSAVRFAPPAESPDDEYPFTLTTGRILYHYHTGTMSRRVEGLNELRPGAYVEISPSAADGLGVADGDQVTLVSRRGRVRATAKVTPGIADDVVFMPFHFAEAAANRLTNPALDPKAKIPELKVCAVRVEKAAR